MTNEVKKVPELRFPEFDGEWEEKQLKNLLSFSNGVNASKEQYGAGRKFINVLDILNNNFILYKNIIGKVSVSQDVEQRYKVEYGDILFLRSSETREDVGVCNVYLDKKEHSLFGGFVIRGKKINQYHPFFLKLLLNNSSARKTISSQAGGSTRFNVSQDILKSVELLLPEIIEQQKIGEFFSKLDRQIELEEQKLEKLEEQKKGYMQKIFSQELRFKDENGNEYPEWEEKRLLNVITLQNGYAFKSNLFSEKGMPIIRITDINKSIVKKGTVFYPESIEINERFKIKQYDILIAMSGATTGKVGKYISKIPSLLNQRIGKFVMKKGTDNNFMFTYLNSLYFKKELSKLLVAGAQPNISSQDIENINLFIPTNEEQRKIGDFFNKLDELIDKQSNKVESLKERKQGLLQKMFV
ncbi:restriction endonuclease subunit S [Mammaliicoccus sciuri]|uniref:restriction endonuclease subunit S n=1 Tax=Mammaliicoccus sciuri TaxID=1296 RepID=UPI003F54969C